MTPAGVDGGHLARVTGKRAIEIGECQQLGDFVGLAAVATMRSSHAPRFQLRMPHRPAWYGK
jgi:hypothetical protein